jgi:hypothetical protein
VFFFNINAQFSERSDVHWEIEKPNKHLHTGLSREFVLFQIESRDKDNKRAGAISL